MRFPGFIGPSYTHASVNVDCQRCVNMYPEMNELGTGKEREIASLVPTPGLRLLATLGASPVRGLWRASNDQVFAVAGANLYSLSSAWAATERGTLNSNSGAVSMADNGTHLVIVDGTDGYTWNMDTSTFAEITDSDFYSADLVTYQDGYFIFNRAGTNQFFLSGLNAVDFDPLDIASAEGSPDPIKGLVSCNQNLYIFGAQSLEVFYNSGDADFPFARMQGAVTDVGCSATHTIQKLEGSVYWLGGGESGRAMVYRTEGYQAKRISTTAIESEIRALTTAQVSSSRAWSYQQGGHLFYCLNLGGSDSTWVFDASTGLWHERTYLTLFGMDRHRAECHTVGHGLNVVGDYENGKLYELDPTVYTDAGDAIRRLRASPHFSSNLRRVFHKSFQLDMETGVGLSGAGQGTNPLVMVRWSDDGGHSWSTEQQMSAGAIGKFKTRAILRRLGSSRDRVYEVSMSDPVKVVWIGAELDVEEGVA